MTRTERAQLKGDFLASFSKTGNVSESCHAVGIGRRTVYDWQEQDDSFAAGFRQAEIEATEYLESVARKRATEGVEKVTPIYHNGKLIDTIIETKHSDTLLIFLLKARAPEKYRENVNINHGGRIEHAVTIADIRKAVGIES